METVEKPFLGTGTSRALPLECQLGELAVVLDPNTKFGRQPNVLVLASLMRSLSQQMGGESVSRVGVAGTRSPAGSPLGHRTVRVMTGGCDAVLKLSSLWIDDPVAAT